MRVKQIKENYEKIFDWGHTQLVKIEREQATFIQVKQISNN